MSVAAEIAALSALARRLSEPWPAEERAWRWDGLPIDVPADAVPEPDAFSARGFPHVAAPDGFWQHRRSKPGKEVRSSVWRGAREIQRADEQGAAQAVAERVQSPPARHHRSWMPSIARVGPIVFRWPAETVTPEPEAWRTYESIMAALGGRLASEWDLQDTWWRAIPPSLRREVYFAAADARAREDNPDAFARALAARLAQQPVHLHAVVHPRQVTHGIRGARRRRSRARWSTGLDRATLGSLAARYCTHRPDGSYNRHDARRWMRRFRIVASVAGDAIECWGLAWRLTAIRTLLEMVGLDDAVRLTERPTFETWSNAPIRQIRHADPPPGFALDAAWATEMPEYPQAGGGILVHTCAIPASDPCLACQQRTIFAAESDTSGISIGRAPRPEEIARLEILIHNAAQLPRMGPMFDADEMGRRAIDPAGHGAPQNARPTMRDIEATRFAVHAPPLDRARFSIGWAADGSCSVCGCEGPCEHGALPYFPETVT